MGIAGTTSADGGPVLRDRFGRVATDVRLSLTDNIITLNLTGANLPATALPVPLQGLPFRVNLHSVTVTGDGVAATGTADHVTLGS